MTSYEVEHDIPANQPDPPAHSHPRPDLSTFFSTLELIDTTNTNNSHAVPTPGDLAAAFRSLADAYHMMRREGGGELLETLMVRLYEIAERPPREVKGVSDEFLADEYPLVVRLPCHKSHIFDLECISPWLKLHATCPLDRKDLMKKKEPAPPPPKAEEEEGEWDDMYA